MKMNLLGIVLATSLFVGCKEPVPAPEPESLLSLSVDAVSVQYEAQDVVVSVTADGLEINIDAQQSVFAFIGKIQEETHRFAISYHRKLRSKRLSYSELDQIPGIGPKRKADLIKTFKSIHGIKHASMYELERILPKDSAIAVYQYYSDKKE